MKRTAVSILVSLALASQAFAVLRPLFPKTPEPPSGGGAIIIGDDTEILWPKKRYPPRGKIVKRPQLFVCTANRRPSPRCASAIQIVRPSESIAETQSQLQPALLRLSDLSRCGLSTWRCHTASLCPVFETTIVAGAIIRRSRDGIMLGS